MYPLSDQPVPTPLDVFASAVHRFNFLTPQDDIPTAFEEVRTALLDLLRASPDPNAYVHSLAVLRVVGPIERGDLDKLQERVRYAYSLLP